MASESIIISRLPTHRLWASLAGEIVKYTIFVPTNNYWQVMLVTYPPALRVQRGWNREAKLFEVCFSFFYVDGV